MKSRNAIAGLALLLVALALLLARQRTSPGALAEVHAREHLSDPARCADCHAGEGRVMADACSACHAVVGTAIAEGRGLHGRIDPELAHDCARCHGEHQGGGFELVGAPAFARAGFARPEDYRHEGLDFHLDGAHGGLRCEQCHDNAAARVLPEDGQRFLGLAQSCTTCHDDPHEDRYGSDCASCHGQQRPFKSMDGMDHDRFCPLVGSHADLACQACHADGTPRAVDALIGRHVEGDGSVPARDCLACHVSPHRDGFVADVVARFEQTSADAGRPLAPGTSCSTCHSADDHDFRARPEALPAGWHGATGFALDTPHDGLGCEQCHPGLATRAPMAATFADDGPRPQPDLSGFRADFPGRPADDCRACHSDPHGGQFERGDPALDGIARGDAGHADGPGETVGRDCLDCHARHAFAPARFDVPAHATTAFALRGTHAEARCATCHRLPAGAPDTPEGRASRHFAGVATQCSACHASPHRDRFVEGVARRLALTGGDASCGQCHDAGDAGFSGAHGPLLAQAHAAVGFPLDAPHDKVACADCHAGFGIPKLDDAEATPDARLAAASGVAARPAPVAAATAAFTAAYPGRDAEGCATCHADPHAGQFERGPFAGQGCLACHARHAFVPPAFGDSQHARTDFPLDGAHLAVGCNDCHLRRAEARVPGRLAGAPGARAPAAAGDQGPRVFNGTPGQCSACHADAHAAAFDGPGLPARVDGLTGCARCHTTDGFDSVAPGRFDHGRWTDYALEGAHRKLECNACHVTRATPDADGRLFGRAAGRQCNDCHAPGSVRPDGLGGGSR